MQYVYRFGKAFLLALVLANSGCATAILDNEAVLSPSIPDPARFADPICVKLNYKYSQIGDFNDEEGIKDMDENAARVSKLLLPQFNIVQQCSNPIAEFTMVVSIKTRNNWARVPWMFVTVVSLGIIPYYGEEVGTVSIYENDKEISSVDFLHKVLVGAVALPKALYDNKKSERLYNRDQALAIKLAVETKQKNALVAP